jgi:hypothetical protein
MTQVTVAEIFQKLNGLLKPEKKISKILETRVQES